MSSHPPSPEIPQPPESSPSSLVPFDNGEGLPRWQRVINALGMTAAGTLLAASLTAVISAAYDGSTPNRVSVDELADSFGASSMREQLGAPSQTPADGTQLKTYDQDPDSPDSGSWPEIGHHIAPLGNLAAALEYSGVALACFAEAYVNRREVAFRRLD